MPAIIDKSNRKDGIPPTMAHVELGGTPPRSSVGMNASDFWWIVAFRKQWRDAMTPTRRRTIYNTTYLQWTVTVGGIDRMAGCGENGGKICGDIVAIRKWRGSSPPPSNAAVHRRHPPSLSPPFDIEVEESWSIAIFEVGRRTARFPLRYHLSQSSRHLSPRSLPSKLLLSVAILPRNSPKQILFGFAGGVGDVGISQ